ncbi:Zona pellucida sperm-binding protein 2 [Bagarius yarrelli]|uniref:Zona pellucida sperm-binding protein 2 n=1 Tax=Bagarius yarrelli TaxID=175774 RepID=A0A556V2D2_BAGYA|nr:Zona pellucida sperm-binding protein 2 [Bagarius yarrelli]
MALIKPPPNKNTHEENIACCCQLTHMEGQKDLLDKQAVLNEANNAFNNKHFTRAEEFYTEFINICTTSGDCDSNDLAIAYNNRGQVKYFRVDFYDAMDDYSAAIKVNRHFEVPYYNRGVLCLLVFAGGYKALSQHGSEIVTLTAALASQCGYSVESDPWGNTRLHTSLLSCFTQNHGDAVFNIGLRLRLHGDQMSDDLFEVEKTCEYNQWASREILCKRNFMEVSTTLSNIWRMVFYTPKEKPMMLTEAQEAGYGVSITPTRLVLRSPYNAPETYIENINGVQMKIFKVSTYFKQAWSVTIIDSAAACPIGGLSFTDELITWYMPHYITSLMTDPIHQMLENYMGVNGKWLSEVEMMDRGYSMMVTEQHVIVSLPIGGPDGYYKSSVLDNEYHITYTIEPMLEMLWLQGKSELTRHRLDYPIVTPPERRPLHVTDSAFAEAESFQITLGSFLFDVELLNITLATGVMTVEQANGRGYNVQEHVFPNGSKTFSMDIPFSDPAVLKTSVSPRNVLYSLPVTFGLLVLPEMAFFSHSALVEATREDITVISMSGVCDDRNFYILIGHGENGVNFHVTVGTRDLSADLFSEYDVTDNGTHINVTVPFLAQDVVFEKAKCFANGSMTALAVKVKAAEKMIPSQLTLKDPSCKPTFINTRFAFFSFNASSCQTSRTFHDGIMTYQNTITMNRKPGSQNATRDSSDYSVLVVCNYKPTKTLTMTFSAEPQASTLQSVPGFGELPVRMRLARDASYNDFYMTEVPVVQYLKHPLYFEVELLQSTDPQIVLVLENCWASTNHGGTVLKWDLVVNGCANPDDPYQITFTPVMSDARVQYPTHVRRFQIQMFTFIKDNMPLRDQILVQCETVLCDAHQTDSVCNSTCPVSKAENVKRGVNAVSVKVASHTDNGWSLSAPTGRIKSPCVHRLMF